MVDQNSLYPTKPFPTAHALINICASGYEPRKHERNLHNSWQIFTILPTLILFEVPMPKTHMSRQQNMATYSETLLGNNINIFLNLLLIIRNFHMFLLRQFANKEADPASIFSTSERALPVNPLATIGTFKPISSQLQLLFESQKCNKRKNQNTN